MCTPVLIVTPFKLCDNVSLLQHVKHDFPYRLQTLFVTMQARSESLYRWQCCGCKALFLNEKNVKLHVAFQLKIEARAAA